jgi:hypothetical protein
LVPSRLTNSRAAFSVSGVRFSHSGSRTLLGRVADAFHVGVGVLDDEALHLLRALGEQAEADRAAVILHVEDVRGQAEHIDQARTWAARLSNV